MNDIWCGAQGRMSQEGCGFLDEADERREIEEVWTGPSQLQCKCLETFFNY
jgi:hypothetical protein